MIIPLPLTTSILFLVMYGAIGAAIGVVVATLSIMAMTPTMRSLTIDGALGALGYLVGMVTCGMTSCAEVNALAIPTAVALSATHEVIRWKRRNK